MPAIGATCRLAEPEDAPAFHAFLRDPAIHAPIYTLPNPLTLDSIRDFISAHSAERGAGQGLLFVNVDTSGDVVGYQDISIWPQWAAGKLGGAVHPRLQGGGQGTRGAAHGFTWMFDALGLDLICETAALDNVRTARLLEGLGFERKGDVMGRSLDGILRPARVWEMNRTAWEMRREQAPL